MIEARILIVEDEVIAAKSLELRLTRLGYTVAGIIAFGEEALHAAQTLRADLVLMDINLRGEMDGIQAAELIRTRLDIPVIFTTAQDDDSTLQRAKITDPFGYLVKPFETREIRTSIEMAMYKHATDRRLRESEQRYRIISEMVSDYTYSGKVNTDGRITFEWVTDAFEKTFGYSMPDLNAMGAILPAVFPEDIDLIQARGTDILAGKARVDEYRAFTKHGEMRWVRHYARPIWDAVQQRVVQIYGGAQDITERKRAETILQDSEARYRMIAEQTGQLIYDYTISSGKIEWQGLIQKLTGYTPKEFAELGMPGWEEHIHPEDRAPAVAQLEQAMQHNTPYNATYRFRKKDGTYLDVEDNGIFLNDADGKGYRMLGTMKDISERKRTEQALANERALLRTVIHNLPDLIYVKDRASRYVLNNPTHLQSLGETESKNVLGKSAFDYYPEHQAARFYADEQTVMNTGEPMIEIEETVLDRRTESVRWHLTSKVPLRNVHDQIIGMVGISRDITDRKHVQDELARDKVLFEQLFENAPVGIVMLDELDRVKRINSAFERIFQFSLNEIVGKSINDLIVPPSHTIQAARMSRKILRGETIHEESMRQRHDGTRVPVEVYGIPVVLKNKTIGLYAMYVDITERKRVEEQLQFASTHDALTGIFNRAYFETQLEHLQNNSKYPVSIVMVDVDRLKQTNDTLGHAAGDQLLRHAAIVLQSAFRSDDIVARIGGDEFAVLLPNTDQSFTADAIARVVRVLAAHNANTPNLPLSFSLGAATACEQTTLGQAMIDADAAMYQQKISKHLS